MRLRLGTRLSSPPGPKYRGLLSFAEAAFPGGLPKPAKLGPWVEGSTKDQMALSLIAPQETIFDAQGRLWAKGEHAPLDRLAAAAEALQAKFVVLETKRHLSPGQRDRDQFADYCERLRTRLGATTVVWRTGGMWEVESAAAFAQQASLIMASNPLDTPVWCRPHTYFQLHAEGVTKRFGEDHFASLADSLLEMTEESEERDVFVALESPRSFRETTRLLAICNDSGLNVDGPG